MGYMEKKYNFYFNNGLKKRWIIIISLCSIFFSSQHLKSYEIPYKGKKKVLLGAGQEVLIETKEKLINSSVFYNHTIILKNDGVVVWSKKIKEINDLLWRYLHIIPIRKGKYSADLNNDGLNEIAILPWHAGQAAFWTPRIFTVGENELEVYEEVSGKFNLEKGPNVLFGCSGCNRFNLKKCSKCY